MSKGKDYQADMMLVAQEKRRAAIEMDLLTGLGGTHQLAIRYGVDVSLIKQDIDAIYERWIGDRPKQAKLRRERHLKVLERVHKDAHVEFEKSKQVTESVSTTYTPKECSNCKGEGKVKPEKGRASKCSACSGTGQIMEEVVTRKATGKCGDPRYLMVQIACTREMSRLDGSINRQKKLNAQEKAEQKHLHIHLNQIVDKWKDAPPEDLLQAKLLVDKLMAVPGRKQMEDEG